MPHSVLQTSFFLLLLFLLRPRKNDKLPRSPEGRAGVEAGLAPAPCPLHFSCPSHNSLLLNAPFAWPLLFLGPHLALEGDELGVKASEREVGKVRASRHSSEALWAQVHALGWAPPGSQWVVAILRPLGLLLPRSWAGIQGPRGQRLPETRERGWYRAPGEGRWVGQTSSGTSPLSWGLQRLALPHSQFLVPLQAHHC